MKKILILFFCLILHLFPSLAFAQEGWVINNFHSEIQIKKTGEVSVVEKIDVDFGKLSKHGIYRDIPYIYQDKYGNKTYTEIDIKEVTQNYAPAKYEVLRNGYNLQIKIGNPDFTISGQNSYTIEYIARGVLRSVPEYDELYWNATGNYWPVQISSASASVKLPEGGIIKTSCFEGYAGSSSVCKSTTESSSASFVANQVLNENQGMTIVVGYKKDLVPLITIEEPKSFWEKFTERESLTKLFLGLAFIVIVAFGVWLKYGRDYWFGDGIFGSKKDQGEAKPMGAHETTVVEFTPPEKLRPAELGVLMDEKADTLDVVSTIIDLAQRGFLTITEIPKKWVFGETDHVLKKLKKDKTGLLSYENILLNKLFEGRSEIAISDLKSSFSEELTEVKKELYKEVVSKGLFPSDPEKVRKKYTIVAPTLFVWGILMIVIMIYELDNVVANDKQLTNSVNLVNIGIVLVFLGIVLLIVGRYMPRRTAYGRDLYRRIKGYRLFIEKAEKHRQKFFEKKNLINEVLPYAIVFGLTGKFAKAMESMGISPAATGWYSGTHHMNMHALGSSMDSFSKSISTAIASTPSSSGGFSGGGSSGGGFGGGGGGSW